MLKIKMLIVIILIAFLGCKSDTKENTSYPIRVIKDLPPLSLIQSSFKNNEKELKNLLYHFKNKENLYLKASKKNIKHIKSQYPNEVKKTIAIANQILDKYFLFRYDWDMEKTNVPHQFKNEIDWKAIPNGDPEWCFMLNRHRFWIDLTKAYWFTDDEKYAKEFVDQINHWIDNNPLNEELKAYSWRRIEAGIRIENWIKSFEFVKESKHITPEFLSKFLQSLYQHGNYLNSQFSDFSKTSNWGVLEFHGVFNLSQFLTDFKMAKEWQKDALEKLNTCINLQILEDGTQWEQSPMYHNEVMHCFMNVNLLAQRNNIKLPESIIKKTKDMAIANIEWQKPNYHQPLLGDSDNTDLRGLLTTAAVIFKDSIIKSRAHAKLDYDNYLLFGKKDYQKIKSSEPNFLSAYQKSSGDYYMRSSWKTDATYTSFHLKKLGCGHGHDNLLHFTLFANGKDYLIDGGRFSYVDNEWRSYFKSNKSHNTLGVDDLTNSIYKDSWTNSFEATSDGIYTKSANDYDYAEAINYAYKRLEDPVTIKRRILYLKPNVWLLFDSFYANEKHKYSQYFNFKNDSISILDNGLSTSFNKNNLRIQPINQSKIEITDSWWSPEYNLKLKTKRAEISNKKNGFHSFITLLYFPEKNSISYKKTPVYSRKDVLLYDEEAEAINLKIDDENYTIFVVNNPSMPANFFYKTNNQFVKGEFVLIKKNKKENNTIIIKS